jgi:hypothetical protein
MILNAGIAIANACVLVRCWRVMHQVDKTQLETAMVLSQAIVLKERFKKLNPDYVDPTD